MIIQITGVDIDGNLLIVGDVDKVLPGTTIFADGHSYRVLRQPYLTDDGYKLEIDKIVAYAPTGRALVQEEVNTIRKLNDLLDDEAVECPQDEQVFKDFGSGI